MNCLIDMDGVLVDFVGGFRRAWAKRGHPDYFAEWTVWDFFAFVPKEYHGELHAVMCEPGFFRGLPAMPGAQAALAEMAADGHALWICSTPWPGNNRCVEEKIDWLVEHFGETLALKRSIFTQDKTIIHGDLLVDDKPHIKGAATPTWQQVVYTHPYNVHVTDKPHLTWATWREVFATLKTQ